MRARTPRDGSARPGRSRAMLVLAATLALPAGPAPALDPSRPPHTFARTIFREELPQASVLALLQSAEGYLWLGTYEGLVRFDGDEFQVWDRQTFPAMRTNVTQCLAEDVSGGIWFGTSRGGYWSPEGRRGRGLRARVGPAVRQRDERLPRPIRGCLDRHGSGRGALVGRTLRSVRRGTGVRPGGHPRVRGVRRRDRLGRRARPSGVPGRKVERREGPPGSRAPDHRARRG